MSARRERKRGAAVREGTSASGGRALTRQAPANGREGARTSAGGGGWEKSFAAVPHPPAPSSLHAALAKVPAFRGPTCQAKKNDGTRCGGGATARSGYTTCPRHSNVPEEIKALWWTKGGHVATGSVVLPNEPDPDLATPDHVTEYLRKIAGWVTRGELGPGQGQALVAVANSALRAYDAALARKIADMESLLIERAKRVPTVRVE